MNKYSDVVSLTQKLIQINSENPPGDERKIVSFIKAYLKQHKLTSRIYEFKKNRPNLVVRIPSRKRKRTLLVTPHIDTVPAHGTWKHAPFSGKIVGNKLYGRGATDCKSNVACALHCTSVFNKEKIKLNNLDLVFAFCADEETGSHYGTIPLVKKLKNIDWGLVLDSDECHIVIAQKGLLHLKVEVFGKEAHGAFPERGINAIAASVRALNAILNKKFTYKRHPLLIKPTLNIGRIEGGEKVNIVAGYASFELDIRYIPSMDKTSIIKMLTACIKKYCRHYRITILAHQEPIEVNRNAHFLKVLVKTLRKHKIKPSLQPSFGATVINFLEGRGIEACAFGFGSRGTAHTKDEYVRISNLHTGVNILKDYFIALDKTL